MLEYSYGDNNYCTDIGSILFVRLVSSTFNTAKSSVHEIARSVDTSAPISFTITLSSTHNVYNAENIIIKNTHNENSL